MKNLMIVLLVVAMVVGMGAVREQALRGEMVVNGDPGCDDNPHTPTPACIYYLPVTPFTINAAVP